MGGAVRTLYRFRDVEAAVYLFSLFLTGTPSCAPEDLLDTVPEHDFPFRFSTLAMPVISLFPCLRGFDGLSMSLSISTVRECATHMHAWRNFCEWLDEWKMAGKAHGSAEGENS